MTLKIDKKLFKAAKHQALSEGVSFSEWMAQLIRKEIDQTEMQEESEPGEELPVHELEGHDIDGSEFEGV